MPPALRALPILLILAATAQAQYVPPVLKGVQGDGTGRRALTPIRFPDPHEEWILARTKHFLFVSSAGERRTREIAAGLETLAAALTRMSPRFAAGAGETRVFIFSRHREAQPYFDLLVGRKDANVTGLFVSSKDGGSMLIESRSGWGSDRTPFHELVHWLISNSGTRPPLWLEEGLAEFFSNAELRNGSIRAGEPVAVHVQTLRQRGRIPLPQLFSVASESDLYKAPESQPSFYAESWALVEWLIRTDEKAFFEFMHDLEGGTDVPDALRARYHRPIDDLQRAFEISLGRPNFGTVIPVPNADTSVVTAPLGRADLLYRLGKFLAQVEQGGADAERHFREALAVNPRHARALAALGEYEQAIAADPNDSEIDVEYAESLLGKQIGPLAESEPVTKEDEAPFRKARQLAQRAVELTPDDGRAWGDLGTSYIVERDPSAGIAPLEKARQILPGRLDYAVHLFALYRRTVERAKADALFAVLDHARNAQVSYALRASALRIELARAHEFLQQQKLEQAAAVIRDLAAHTDDAGEKGDLTRQADDIEQTAETNRQIDAYNRAVNLVNMGDYAKAKRALDRLLQSATDPGVIHDATNLRARLALRGKW